MLERVERLLSDIIREIEDKFNMICKVYNNSKGIDEVHLTNSKLNEFMRKLKKDIINRLSSTDLQQK